MAYRLEEDEPLGAGIQRVSGEALDASILGLRTTGPLGVHAARIGIKRVRSLLRASRSTLGDAVFTEETARLRSIGRSLSAARDAVVLVEALDELRERAPLVLGERAFEELRERFVAQRDARQIDDAVRAAAVADLLTAKARIGQLSFGGRGFGALERGVRAIYASGRKRFEQVSRRIDDERAHALRKRVKDLTHVITLIEPIWPVMLLGVHETLKKLGERLGEDHDLALLRAALAREAVLLPDELAMVTAAVDSRRETLRAKAHPLGARLFVERPERFTRRLGAYWTAWRAAGRVRES